MALNIRKFLVSRIILSAAVFISLSGVTYGEPRECYWCGPLAEQVHRSQRAPPCNGPTEVTVCDPGFPYCAIVATAPPYVESRYCVKLYQDECYPLYCNSTRTWRMTCPCRGDLCNGPETEREHEAFAVLAKLVARTHNTRFKRSLISPLHLVNMDSHTQTKGNLDENKTNDVSIEESDLVNIEFTEIITAVNLTDNQVEVIKEINKTFSLTDTVQIGVPEPDENDILTTESAVIQNPVITMTGMKGNNDITSKSYIQNYSPNIDNSYPRTEIIIMSSETPKIMTSTSTISPVITPSVPDNKLETIKSTVGTSTVKNNDDMAKLGNKQKSNEILPPAEALQHNEMPTVKPTEVTTSTTHKVMTTQHSLTTTKTYKSQNNTAIKVHAHLVVLFIGIILQN